MSEVCDTCGLPHELCVCDDVSRSETEVEVYTEERKWNKTYTIVDGVGDVDSGELASHLKKNLACGGTEDGERIELQGDHIGRIEKLLKDEGLAVA